MTMQMMQITMEAKVQVHVVIITTTVMLNQVDVEEEEHVCLQNQNHHLRHVHGMTSG